MTLLIDKHQGCAGAGCESAENWGTAAFFTKQHMTMLKEIMYEKRAEAGSHLFWEGDEAGKLYFIRSGRIKLTKTAEEGRTLRLCCCFYQMDGTAAPNHPI